MGALMPALGLAFRNRSPSTQHRLLDVYLTCAFCQTDAGRGRNAKCVWDDVIPLCGFLSPAKATNAKATNSPSIAIMIGFMGSLLGHCSLLAGKLSGKVDRWE